MAKKEQSDTDKIIDGVKGLLKKGTKIVKDVADDAIKIGTDIKTEAYRAAAKLEKSASGEGAIGRAAASVDALVQKTTDLYQQRVVEKGGVLTIAGNAVDGLANKVESTYKTFENAVTTDGKLDPEKITTYLSKGADAVGKFSEKAYNALLAARDGVVNDCRKEFPSVEELRTTYKGFGTSNPGKTYHRTELDAALAFYEHAKSEKNGLPNGLKAKRELLETIKANVVPDWTQLSLIYTDLNDPGRKMRDILDKYRSKLEN